MGENWTEEQEALLVRSWTLEDQTILDSVNHPNESPLWEACHLLFDVAPPDVLPKGVTVDISRNAPFVSEDGRQFWNYHWPKKVCVALHKVLKLFPFAADLEFFRYIIKYVLFLRCDIAATRHKPIPPEDNSGSLADSIITELANTLHDKNGTCLGNKAVDHYAGWIITVVNTPCGGCVGEAGGVYD